MLCPACGAINPADSRFCMACGASVGDRAEQEVASAEAEEPDRSERAGADDEQASPPVPEGLPAAPTWSPPVIEDDASASPTEPGDALGTDAGMTEIEAGAPPPPPEPTAPDPPSPPPSDPAPTSPSPPVEPPLASEWTPPSAPPPPDPGAWAPPAAPPGPTAPWLPPPGPPPAPSLPAPPVPTQTDPYALGGAAARMAQWAQGAARTALVAAAAVLQTGERVEGLAQGNLEGVPAVVALTDRRVLAVNQRDWAPTVVSYSVDGNLGVQAWEDPQAATVVLSWSGHTITLDGITDKQPAYDLVARIRARTGRP